MGEKLQRIIGVLHKLGILRVGTKKYTYTSGKDMPTEAILDDVYDEKKDTVSFSKKEPSKE